jgi:hypothetical protein
MSLKNKLLSWHDKPEIVGRICSQAAALVVKESVEPLLEDYRPPGITSLKFNKFSLGTVPPKIEGMNQQMLISVMQLHLLPYLCLMKYSCVIWDW